jgi:signal transduction histidine kinase
MRIELYSHKNQWKFALLGVAVLIALGTLWYTESFLKELRAEEDKRALIWAEAVKVIANSNDIAELTLALQVVEKNTTIPIIMTDVDTTIVTWRNLKMPKRNEEKFLQQELQAMISDHEPIIVQLGEGNVQYMFYRDSSVLTKLRIYPMVLLGVIGLFIAIAYMAFSNVRRSEQNRVWTGMAKETAHQIGTPLSSLMGWIEILRGQQTDESILGEMEKDVLRLQTITDRFSKIGSQPQLKVTNIADMLADALNYLNNRTSNRIALTFSNRLTQPALVPLNTQLFGWVIENLVRNAIDAIEGKGKIDVTLDELGSSIIIEVTDTGKGIAAAKVKAVFRPGYTTKTRGWGIGLSLAKRIVKEYHKGKISVVRSTPGKGTTFRIVLPKAVS